MIRVAAESWAFVANCWLDAAATDGCEVELLAAARVVYEVQVLTGRMMGAGTDAAVSIELFGLDAAGQTTYLAYARTHARMHHARIMHARMHT